MSEREQESMRKVAVFPGSFDPFTFGHLDIVTRAMKIFDSLLILVLNNPRKSHLFPLEERVSLIKRVIEEYELENVFVDSHSGLMVDYLKEKGYRIVVRGLRVMSDFEYEVLQAHANSKLFPDMETVFLFTSPEYSFLSSTLVKELASFGVNVSSFVPKVIEEALIEAFKTSGGWKS